MSRITCVRTLWFHQETLTHIKRVTCQHVSCPSHALRQAMTRPPGMPCATTYKNAGPGSDLELVPQAARPLVLLLMLLRPQRCFRSRPVLEAPLRHHFVNFRLRPAPARC